jgi:iron complex outermembrane receptor protein
MVTPALAADFDPLDFSLGELAAQEVITVARKRQEIGDVPAAVFVVSAEDIARMGVTTVPDALRLVPGVQVAAMSNNRWAVSVRGFNGRFSNSLLVMVDGRTVYSPLFSGTFWEAHDVPLAEIDRIEVIRGPGASIWGANAVNGIVNIITKWSRATQGDEVRLTVGTEDRGILYARHGGQLDGGHYRISYQGRARDESHIARAGEGEDAWHTQRVGLRMERFVDDVGEFSVNGEVFSNNSDDYWYLPDATAPGGARGTALVQKDRGAALTVGLNRIRPDGSEWRVQGSLQYVDKQVGALLSETRNTFDLEGQYRFTRGDHDIVVGTGLRYHDQVVHGSGFFSFDQARRRFGLVSAFVHDEITLVPDTLSMTAGFRFEHHTWTGNEWQPNLRLAWTPAPRHLVWGAISEASRTPARIEYDARYAPFVVRQAPLVLAQISSPQHLDAERVRAFEIGYRGQPSQTVNFDATAFYMRYHNLRTIVEGEIFPSAPWLVLDSPMVFDAESSVGGVELALDWQPSARWRTRFAYTRLNTRLIESGDDFADSASRSYMERVPREQFSMHLTWKPMSGHALDVIVRHVGDLVRQEEDAEIPNAYTELDVSYAWRYSPRTTFSLVGRNLLDARHAEFGRDYMPAAIREIERSVHLTAQWSFD